MYKVLFRLSCSSYRDLVVSVNDVSNPPRSWDSGSCPSTQLTTADQIHIMARPRCPYDCALPIDPSLSTPFRCATIPLGGAAMTPVPRPIDFAWPPPVSKSTFPDHLLTVYLLDTPKQRVFLRYLTIAHKNNNAARWNHTLYIWR